MMHTRARRDAATEGLLLVGHGTRDAAGRRGFLAIADEVASLRSDLAVQPGFLEFCQPTIGEGMQHLVARQVRQVTVAPLLLFAAGHVKRDIPQAVAASLADAPEVTPRWAPHLGCHAKLVELSVLRYREALTALEPRRDEETLLVLVGRGSSDAEATAEMRQFAELRAALAPVGRLEVCFCALAHPSLAETLSRAAELGFARVVVQPHLLLTGDLQASVKRQVGKSAAMHPNLEWVVTDPLGPDRRLAEVVVEVAQL